MENKSKSTFFFFNIKAIRPKAKARDEIKKISRNFSIIKFIFVMELWRASRLNLIIGLVWFILLSTFYFPARKFLLVWFISFLKSNFFISRTTSSFYFLNEVFLNTLFQRTGKKKKMLCQMSTTDKKSKK